MVKRNVIFCLVLFLCIDTGLVYAFDTNQLQTFKSTKTCNYCDLSFANLSKTILYNSQIQRRILLD